MGDVVYIVLFALLFAVATLPVGFYLGHMRERRYGMTSRSAGAFLREAGKAAGVGTAFALVLLVPFFWLARNFEAWWALAALLYGAYLVLSAAVIPQLVLPIFYKVEPMPEGPLRDAVVSAARGAGLEGTYHVVVLRESSKSPRANAFVHGLGRTRRIVLYDTLVNRFHPREVAFTVAHEVAHIAHRDVPKSLAISLAAVGPGLFLLSRLVEAGAPLGGASGAGDVAVVPLLFVLLFAFGAITRPASSWLHRRSERAADRAALEATGDGLAAASMLRRICDLNLLDESPPPLVERFANTHPSPRHRIDEALAFERRRLQGGPVPNAPAG
jgi:STE24 endopeptidase